jgi:phospho-N-acetylmuramoyl-pentapeptide-transferase
MIRLLLAAAIAMASSLAGTRLLIWWLTKLQIGQPIRDDGPQGHATKAGTPTMGGLAIVGGALLGYVLSDLYRGIYTRSGIFVMLAIMGGGAVGLMDDWIKVVRERSLGLNKRTKMLGLLAVAVTFAILMLEHAPTHTQLSFTRFDQPGLELGSTLWAIWAVLLIIGSANAVNLTDGLDGLAAGAGTFCFGAYTVIAFWQFRYPETYDVAHALDLAVVAASMAGGCLGFLWWNAAPARIFMGDTGSLAIGTGLATLALTTNTHLLLPVVAGLFVAETVSVILQVGSFRLLGGRRVFSMAPVHHHFELRGWPETTVIIRFWIMSGLCTAVGLGIFYADSIASGAVGG